MPRLRLALIAVSVTALSIIVSGCGTDDGLGTRYKISGTVTYKGEPLKKGKINFVPENTQDRTGSGDIEDGNIVNVTTQSPGDGLLPGKYKVAITAVEDVDTSAARQKYKAAPDPVEIAKASSKAKKLIPTKYANAIDSGFTADVSSSNRSFKFDLVD